MKSLATGRYSKPQPPVKFAALLGIMFVGACQVLLFFFTVPIPDVLAGPVWPIAIARN
jgi:hypothetical protein